MIITLIKLFLFTIAMGALMMFVFVLIAAIKFFIDERKK